MKQKEIKLNVVWEVISTPDATDRQAAAFAMLLGAHPSSELLPDQDLDSLC
jgi:hypothetical protein